MNEDLHSATSDCRSSAASLRSIADALAQRPTGERLARRLAQIAERLDRAADRLGTVHLVSDVTPNPDPSENIVPNPEQCGAKHPNLTLNCALPIDHPEREHSCFGHRWADV